MGKDTVEEGIVPGGGIALLRCIPFFEAVKTEGEVLGVNIIRRKVILMVLFAH
jgi:chaperonin GroEL